MTGSIPLGSNRTSTANWSSPDELLPPRELQDWVGLGGPSVFKATGNEFLGYLVDLCGLQPGDAVLDVGCGSGRMALPLTGYLNHEGRYAGFDVAQEAIAWCTQNISGSHPNFDFRVADVQSKRYNPTGKYKSTEFRFPYPDGSFDVVLLASVFTHMLPADVKHYMDEIVRVLKPGGRSLITFFVLNEMSTILSEEGMGHLKFEHEVQGARTANVDNPEAAIAYPEAFVRDLYGECGLEIREPLHYGNWSGRIDAMSGQDVVIAVKGASTNRLAQGVAQMIDIERPKGVTSHPEAMGVSTAITPASGAPQSMPCMSPAAAEEYIASLYATVLKRDPTPEESAHWVNNAAALPPEQVYFAFVNSEEYKRRQEKSVPTMFPPGHYYSPIVDPSTIVEYIEKQYLQEPGDIEGIHFDEDAMVRFWKENAELINNTPFSEHDDGTNRYYYDNSIYPYADAAMLRAMIAHFKPKNIIEVGSGFSTACILDAADHFGLSDLSVTCIDPDADRLRSRLRKEDRSRVEIIEGLVQDVPVSTFSKLNENDILFIDSTHVLKTASDVHYELFSILPSLNKGVLIHVHDIPYPFEYARRPLLELNPSWNEIYALRAFLMYNSAFEVVFWNGLLAHRQRELVLETNPRFLWGTSSIWLRARSAEIQQTQHAHTESFTLEKPMVKTPGAVGKRSLRGNVGRIDKFLIAGWALCEDEPAERPEIQFVQDGEVVITLRPCFPAPQLRAALSLPASPAAPTYHWRLWMPLANGLRPDVPFSVVFRENGAPLGSGEGRRLAAMQSIDPAARADLDEAVLFTPSIARLEDALDVSVVVEKPIPPRDVTVKLFDRSETSILQLSGSPSVLGKETDYGRLRIPRSQLMAAPGPNLRIGVDSSEPGDSRSQFQSSLRSLWIPKAVFDASLLSAPLPDVANIHRVSGPTSDAFQYLVFGATTFHQLDLIARRHAGRPIADLETVLDWGVGCGRVLRQIRESGEGRARTTIGLDIDEVNIRWCAENLAAHGDFGVLSLDGFELEKRSVDFLYGISVMTHLTEHHQLMWLDQIRRILKPGGLAVLTVNGEGQYYRQPQTLFAPFVERFGFFDSIADDAIGEDRSTYYRATYNSRSYIRQTWSRYFEIIDVIVMGHHFAQDYVVLRRPAD